MGNETRIKITVCGTDYSIISDDSAEYTMALAQEIDQKISTLMTDNSRLTVTMAAVLSALDYCDAAHKANESAEGLRAQIKNYLEDSKKARLEADDTRREIERLKRELQALRIRISEIDDR